MCLVFGIVKYIFSLFGELSDIYALLISECALIVTRITVKKEDPWWLCSTFFSCLSCLLASLPVHTSKWGQSRLMSGPFSVCVLLYMNGGEYLRV